MIEGYSFGRITIQGRAYTDDVLICREKLVYPWWRQRGHAVTVKDLDAILDQEPEILILGQGQPGQMKATQELQVHLQELGIELIQVPTQEAVERFNRHVEQGNQICGGFHLTC